MFKKLRTRIIIATMAITTFVLVLAGSFIMLFSSTMRPEPRPHQTPMATANEQEIDASNIVKKYDNQEIKEYINIDRREGAARLLSSLFLVGVSVEIAVFLVTWYLSKNIIKPVKDTYDKQKLFIANASHELKTPLAIIQANVEALDVNKGNEKWKNNIENEISSANKLVSELLQLAKIDAGGASKEPLEKVNLSTAIKKRIQTFKLKFTNGDIVFNDHTKSATQLLPKQDILRVLDILLDNATKYGDKQVLVILDKNSITVSNDGVIISKNDTQKIFDRFYQADKTKEGSGLGLAIAKTICEQNGWTIRCESSDQTTFIVSFPCYR
ncbi:HAMP domain-containing histidine kinase [Candidatus Saccharibacteria bacterium]|nr:HAMP domain-containing histidine kinase [Candidatus Saccharibacteria bacterium]